MRLDARADGLHDLGIDADQVVAAHARLARHARRDDHDVGARDVGVVRRTFVGGVEAFDRGRLGDVQRLALGDALGVRNVEQDDVTEFLDPGEQRQRAADLTRADQRDFIASHAEFLVWGKALNEFPQRRRGENCRRCTPAGPTPQAITRPAGSV